MGKGGYTPKTAPANPDIPDTVSIGQTDREGTGLTLSEHKQYGNPDGDQPSFAMPPFADGPDCRNCCKTKDSGGDMPGC